MNGTHSRGTVSGFFGLGQDQKRKSEFHFDADHPEVFASEDLGATPVAAIARHGNIQLRSVSATD